ncbi:hypothetical protein PSPO01_16336 [Paraphaeosphaeria sporulosa]
MAKRRWLWRGQVGQKMSRRARERGYGVEWIYMRFRDMMMYAVVGTIVIKFSVNVGRMGLARGAMTNTGEQTGHHPLRSHAVGAHRPCCACSEQANARKGMQVVAKPEAARRGQQSNKIMPTHTARRCVALLAEQLDTVTHGGCCLQQLLASLGLARTADAGWTLASRPQHRHQLITASARALQAYEVSHATCCTVNVTAALWQPRSRFPFSHGGAATAPAFTLLCPSSSSVQASRMLRAPNSLVVASRLELPQCFDGAEPWSTPCAVAPPIGPSIDCQSCCHSHESAFPAISARQPSFGLD